MSSPYNYESVLHAVSQWPVDRRAMLAHALVEGLKNEAAGRRTSPSPVVLQEGTSGGGGARAAESTSPTPSSQSQEQRWADEAIEDRYRRGGRMG